MARAGLVIPVSVQCDWVGYHVYLWYGTSVCWHKLETGLFRADLTTTVIVINRSETMLNTFAHSRYNINELRGFRINTF